MYCDLFISEVKGDLLYGIQGTYNQSERENAKKLAFNWCECSVTPGGGGALRCFRYRVCAAGQGIVFTILAPEPGIVFCKNAPKRVYPFQIFAPRQDYSVFSWSFAPRQGVVFCHFAPRRGYLNWGKCSQTGWKSQHLKDTHPYILRPNAPPPPGTKCPRSVKSPFHWGWLRLEVHLWHPMIRFWYRNLLFAARKMPLRDERHRKPELYRCPKKSIQIWWTLATRMKCELIWNDFQNIPR